MLTRKQLAELAFSALGKKPSLLPVPRWVMVLSGAMVRVFNPRLGQFLSFVAVVTTQDCLAPVAGTARLQPYFEALARRG